MSQTSLQRRIVQMQFVGNFLACFVCFGCSGGEAPRATAPVSGRVTFNGMPVTGGSLTFSPTTAKKGETAGQVAFGNVESDGSYKMTTYASGDGAIIAKHRITYGAPGAPPIDEKQHTENTVPVVPPFSGLKPKVAEVEVKVGDNKIDIELVP